VASIDVIYLFTAIGLSPCGRSTVHIYTETIHRTIRNKQYIGGESNRKPPSANAEICLCTSLLRKKKNKGLK